jgi:hypothetical protein
MKNWTIQISSHIDYERLIAELSYKEKFLLQLDREDGRESLCISFPEPDGSVSHRVPLSEFIKELQEAAEDLKR